MHVGHLLLHDHPHEVVHLRDDQRAVHHQPDALPPVAVEAHVGRQRQPHEGRADDGQNRSEAGQHAPEKRLGNAEGQVTDIGHHALRDGQQRNDDGVRAHDHVDFAHHAARRAAVERQDFAAVGLHAQAPDQHEIEHEEQHDEVDGEIHDAAHEPLPRPGKVAQHRLQVALGPEVVAGFLLDESGDVPDGRDDRLRIKGHALDFVDDHPDDQADRNEEEEDRLAEQQRRRKAPPPPPPFAQEPHLTPQQHVDRHGPQQAAQKRRQLGEDRETQPRDKHEKRITPVFFTHRKHTPAPRKERAAGFRTGRPEC